MQRTCVGWPARSVRSLRYHGTVLCLADSAPNFTANRSFNDPTPQRYCHANPARSPVRWRVRTNVWRRPTSPWDGAKRLKSGEAIPAARRNCVRRQRQGPLRVSAAGYFMTVGTLVRLPALTCQPVRCGPYSGAPPGRGNTPAIIQGSRMRTKFEAVDKNGKPHKRASVSRGA